MITHLRNKKDIPNNEGFIFWAVMPDGTVEEDKVFKDCNGLHKCKYFSKMIGWMYIR